jgi:hypothetical protein
MNGTCEARCTARVPGPGQRCQTACGEKEANRSAYDGAGTASIRAQRHQANDENDGKDEA